MISPLFPNFLQAVKTAPALPIFIGLMTGSLTLNSLPGGKEVSVSSFMCRYYSMETDGRQAAVCVKNPHCNLWLPNFQAHFLVVNHFLWYSIPINQSGSLICWRTETGKRKVEHI